MRAVVVGAGIGGLAAAIALEQAGIESIVIERAPELREAGFGLVVSANAVTALRSLGLRDGVAARGTRVRRAEIRNPRGELLTLIDYEALGWETYGILRAELQRAMLEVAPAERLRLGTTCIGATEDGQVLLNGADPVIADVVVGADGIHSAVRRSLFGEEPLPPNHPLAERPVISASDLVGLPFIGLERGTRLGEAVRESFAQAGAPFQPTVEVRYCNTACVLAAAGVGAAVVDPFSPRQSGGQDLIVRPFTPKTAAVAYMLWSEAEPLSRLAKAFLNEVRQASRSLDRDTS